MIVLILNYIVRSITIIMGVLFIINPFPAFQDDPMFVRIFGVVVLVFGSIRLALLIRQHRRARLLEMEEENEEE
ncbi:MAG: hypothetical protein U0264_06255 [Candidatus Kapaibacterium sp.]